MALRVAKDRALRVCPGSMWFHTQATVPCRKMPHSTSAISSAAKLPGSPHATSREVDVNDSGQLDFREFVHLIRLFREKATDRPCLHPLLCARPLPLRRFLPSHPVVRGHPGIRWSGWPEV